MLFSHNVQQLTVSLQSSRYVFPTVLFSSQSLKDFKLISNTTKTPLDFPALTTLNLSCVTLWGDLFSKCINLKKLTLKYFVVDNVFDIITPRLCNLILKEGRCSKTINVIAPQLENLRIVNCSIGYLNVSPQLSSFCYTSSYLGCYVPLHFSNDQFHSLNKVSFCLRKYNPNKAYKEEDVRNTINMLQKLHSARYLTLSADTVEYISSFPDLFLHHSSPFSNLVCLTIDSSMRKDVAYKVKMSTEAKNFLLGNSPSATLIMKLSN
ncbi:unnamed protein product [Lactuca virosa]|uniref:Uncharacterized protein n=1 Tax=Lactuca virosa TaxID=75947 RepID=A0AAU9LF76_9ASTR|nr:unnamed protein product [Lactuca virosa]